MSWSITIIYLFFYLFFGVWEFVLYVVGMAWIINQTYSFLFFCSIAWTLCECVTYCCLLPSTSKTQGIINFRKMFYAFLIATDTTIKTEREVLSLPTKHFYVIPNKHQSFELDASAIDCRETKARPLRKRKQKGGSRQNYEIGCRGYWLVRLIQLEYRAWVHHTCNASGNVV